jgi:hypothetical protein
MRKPAPADRIDRRKHDDDLAERVFGGVRSGPFTSVPDEVTTADHRPRRRQRRPRKERKR